MNHYIIDGNNLIGKIKSLQQIQKKDKFSNRERLVHIVNKYFAGKNTKLSLHFDGFQNIHLSVSKGKIIYSDKDSSDNCIRKEIENSKNPRLIILITSDHSLMNFGKANSCSIISSGEFSSLIEKSFEKSVEAEKIKELEKEKNEFLKLFKE